MTVSEETWKAPLYPLSHLFKNINNIFQEFSQNSDCADRKDEKIFPSLNMSWFYSLPTFFSTDINGILNGPIPKWDFKRTYLLISMNFFQAADLYPRYSWVSLSYARLGCSCPSRYSNCSPRGAVSIGKPNNLDSKLSKELSSFFHLCLWKSIWEGGNIQKTSLGMRQFISSLAKWNNST